LEEIKALSQAFDAKIRYDETRERLVQSMSDELAGYRQDLYQNLLRPVLVDLIGVYDDMTQVLESAESPPATASQLEFFRIAVEQVLVRNGAERFAVAGDLLDREHQKVVRVTDVATPGLDRRVERRMRTGFTWNGKVLRPEWVSAYRYVADQKPGPEPEATETGTQLRPETMSIANRVE